MVNLFVLLAHFSCWCKCFSPASSPTLLLLNGTVKMWPTFSHNFPRNATLSWFKRTQCLWPEPTSTLQLIGLGWKTLFLCRVHITARHTRDRLVPLASDRNVSLNWEHLKIIRKTSVITARGGISHRGSESIPLPDAVGLRITSLDDRPNWPQSLHLHALITARSLWDEIFNLTTWLKAKRIQQMVASDRR